MLGLLKISFQRDPVKTSIFLSAGLAHLFFAIWIMTSHAIIKTTRTHKSIIVKTIVPQAAGRTAVSDKPRTAAATRPAAPPQLKATTSAPAKPAPQPQKNLPPAKKEAAAPKKDPAI